MTRQHARPMSAHQRAQRARGAAYAGTEALVLVLGIAAILALLVALPTPHV
jgi:hypothetical protein